MGQDSQLLYALRINRSDANAGGNQMKKDERRWVQRFENYIKALASIDDAAALAASRPLSNLEKQGLIKAFEFTQELAWNLMKDYLEYQGFTGITGSRDSIREAFRAGLVKDGEAWMSTIKSRNLSSHTYNEKTADGLYRKIVAEYLTIFRDLAIKMAELRDVK